MLQRLHHLRVETTGRGLLDITGHVRAWAGAQGIETGLLTLWCRHTSASLLVQENASPDVRADLEAFLARLVPDGGADRYRHAEEGPDDMPAHIRAALTQTQLSVPVADGQPLLGTWQAIYLYEHRMASHRRDITLHLIGEGPQTSRASGRTP
ncbi:secondary thiamine-phosphate synthase enzyme YjbQ [Sabulicella glaciei]|uniref:Secondary thiamine-phosphate synthase enzyme YjbQ n=1 Tax=Sabulicella glaciei TaxID=2984948 RepID=A0ABT3P1K4_9PROT|nr:secondary thiamine-phosphate synthase enzyme YjbQ [Roseococcus sp. MDT2-1-1]MCW8088292.1 secondary thiamine-phosphate synthase enzyme YjbQ [Roseococcus sp. MDT2-1-1]